MFVCIECGKKTKEKFRVFVDQDWCQVCVATEGQRHGKEDSIPGKKYAATRPPKYMLKPELYSHFGYLSKEEAEKKKEEEELVAKMVTEALEPKNKTK